MHGVGKHQPPDPFLSVGNQRLAAQDPSREGAHHSGMLGILPVGDKLFHMSRRLRESFRRGKAILPFAHVQHVKEKLIVFTDQLCLFQGDLKAVGPGGIRRGGHEHARSPVCEFQVGGHIVLYLDVMPFPIVAEGLHLNGKPADPLKQVQIVGALVQQYAAALSVPGCPPSAGVIVSLGAVPVRDDPVHPFDLPILPAVHDLVHLPVNAVGALVEHHGEYPVRLFRRLVHFPYLLRIYPRRLLTQDMQAVLQRRDHKTRVIIVGHRDQYGVADAGPDQRVSIRKDTHIFRKVFLRPLPPALPHIRHRGKTDIRDLSVQDRPAMSAPHVSDSDDSKLYLFHFLFPSFFPSQRYPAAARLS